MLYNNKDPAQAGVQSLNPVYESTAEPNEPPRKAQYTGIIILGYLLGYIGYQGVMILLT